MKGASACILGLGNMGSAMARKLTMSEVNLSVWNRSTPKIAALKEAAAPHSNRIVSSTCPASAISHTQAGAPVLCVLTSAKAVQELLRADRMGQELRGRPFINLASGSPDDAHAIAEVHAEVLADAGKSDSNCEGGVFIDGAYSGPPAKVLRGEGRIFLSSKNRADVEKVTPLLSHLGGVTYCGDIGASKVVDYAVVDLFFVNLLSFMSNKAALEMEGADVEVVIEEMKKRLDTVPDVLRDYNARMGDRSEESYNSDTTVTLRTARNYWTSRLPYLESRGVPAHLTNFMVELVDEAAGGKDGSHSDADISRLQEIVSYGGRRHTQ
mmetsp:Transcript_60167/g.127450  ORF Transcript_60167/g.127450 Transcript_60167/m.127450 type:complete len:325 (+) Transcript_60167:239-1213(+)